MPLSRPESDPLADPAYIAEQIRSYAVAELSGHGYASQWEAGPLERRIAWVAGQAPPAEPNAYRFFVRRRADRMGIAPLGVLVFQSGSVIVRSGFQATSFKFAGGILLQVERHIRGEVLALARSGNR